MTLRRFATIVVFALLLVSPAVASSVAVTSEQQISDTEGEFDGLLDEQDWFGSGVASLGDLDGDGVVDIAVGAPQDEDGGEDRGPGAVWILFLEDDHSVKSYEKLSATEGDFDGELSDGDKFGTSIVALGDLDGDGVTDLAVGASDDDDGGNSQGAVWIVFLRADGTAKDEQKISSTQGDFDGELDANDFFGRSLASLGDLDGDGVPDLVVGAFGDDDGGDERGAVWILFLNEDGTVEDHQKISDSDGEFGGEVTDGGYFGGDITTLGDVDGDGVIDLAVGAEHDGDAGAVWILFLNDDGTVKDEQKIDEGDGGFEGELEADGRFGKGLSAIGDLDRNGVADLAVGAPQRYSTTSDGVVWILFLDTDGTVMSYDTIDEGFDGDTSAGRFGHDLAVLSTTGSSALLAVGQRSTDDFRGSVWILEIDSRAAFLRGDVNGNGEVAALTDALRLLAWAFSDATEPPCMDAADVDDSGEVEPLLDALAVLQWSFGDGDAPADPGPVECGEDPTDDDSIGCSLAADECL